MCRYIEIISGEALCDLRVTDQAYSGSLQKRFYALPEYLVGADWIRPAVNAARGGCDLYSFRIKHSEAVDVFAAYSYKNNYYVYTNDPSPPHGDIVFSDPSRDKTRRIPEFILEKSTKPTSFPEWLEDWIKIYPDGWRGLEVNEEPDTAKTDYYALYKKTFQPGETVNLGGAFSPRAYDTGSPEYDETAVSGGIMPYLVFIRPAVNTDTADCCAPPVLTITSPNSTRMNSPEKIYGVLKLRSGISLDDISISLTVKEECTGAYLNADKRFAGEQISLEAVCAERNGQIEWELDISGVDFKRGKNSKSAEISRGDRYMIDVTAKAGGFNVRGSVNFRMFYKEPPPLCRESAWNDYLPEQILAHIKAPDISNPRNIINITDAPYNAAGYRSYHDYIVASLPRADSCRAINDALEDCSRSGGGRVIIPAGDYSDDTIYFSDGPVWLRDNTELHIEKGARLVFGFSPEKYPSVLTRWGGYLTYNYSPLINACRVRNAALTGGGIIDGNNCEYTWDNWYGSSASRDESVYNLMAVCDARVPLEERRFGRGAGLGYEKLRPSMVQFYECENILIEDVQLKNSPLYNLDIVFSENVTVRGIKIHPYKLYNDDGIDINSSNYVLIENCDISTTDDAVVPKAGMNADAWGRKPSSNIIIRNNRIKSGCWAGAIALGSDISGGIFNVFAESSHVGFGGGAVFLKASGIRGGEVSFIYIRDLTAEVVRDGIWFQTNYSSYGASEGSYPPSFSHIFLDNITIDQAIERAVNIQGLPELKINNIYFNGVTVNSAGKPDILADALNVFRDGEIL
jgi:polygalacturonase